MDCQKVEDAISKFNQILESTWQVVLGYAICIYLIEYNVAPMVVVYLGLTFYTLYLYKYIIKYEIQFMIAKDRRMQLLKNVLKNVKYIKLKVWELYYHAKIFQRREGEMEALKKSNFVFWCVVALNWLNPTIACNMCIASMVLFGGDDALQPARIIAFLRILTTILRGMANLPTAIQFFLEMKVSLVRLNLFLDSQDLHTAFIERQNNPETPMALELEFGSFYWNQMDEKAMKEKSEKARLEKRKIRGKVKMVRQDFMSNDGMLRDQSERSVSVLGSVVSEKDSVIKEGSVNSISKIRNRTLVEDLAVDGDKNIAFQLKDLELAIPKGQLIMIYGDIGSGKSSILYSFLGEMNQKFEEPKPKLIINGSIGFMGQRSWLMAKTVRENIILDQPYDEERFERAVRYSALEDDLKMFAERENRVLGENGENVSGGQRTRIELARMIYQE